MNFKKFTDGLPRPKAYLRAGLPRPLATGTVRHETGTLDDVLAFLSEPQTGNTAATLTIVDEQGELLGVVSRPAPGYLASPPTLDPFGRLTESSHYSAAGFIEYTTGGRHGMFENSQLTRVTESVRSVTFDLSVVETGFDRSLFDKKDALYISQALSDDLLVCLKTEKQNEHVANSYSFPSWFYSTPVPLDHTAVYVLQSFLRDIRPTLFDGSPLTRTDLLCAATAISHESPLYTTHPEDYASVGHGLRVIEYGPVRNKTALAELEARRDEQRAARDRRLALEALRESNAQAERAAKNVPPTR